MVWICYYCILIELRLDATLLELSELIKSVHTDAQKAGTVFEFAVVAPDPNKPVYRMRNIGSICSGFPADSDKIMLKVSYPSFMLIYLY